MKQTIEVEVPDGMEFVEYRACIHPGEYVARWNCDIPEVHRHEGFFTKLPHPTAILRPKWQYPEWLGGAGVAQDSDWRESWHPNPRA